MTRLDPLFMIKICGQTSLADAERSVLAGATMIGVVLYAGSSRHVRLGEAASWISRVAAGVERVAVMVDPTLEEVLAALSHGMFDTAQLHGCESPEFIRALNDAGLGGRIIKALRVDGEASLQTLPDFPTRRFLLDGRQPGSGRRFDWSLAEMARNLRPDASFLLAGGLTPGNVSEAILTARPHGVDVASGVESAPGLKDPEKVRCFVEAARKAARAAGADSP